MHRRLWLSVAMLAAGASLLVAASLASAAGSAPAKIKKGGTYKVATVGGSVSVDPQVAYVSTAWWAEYATAGRLYNYPDKPAPVGTQLVPEIAKSFKVSNNGKKYTFTLRKNFKFSDGKKVTAKSFQYAINRALNKKLNSPGGPFMSDPAGSFIVGADKVRAGSTNKAKGVKAKGNKLIIRLKHADGTFMAKITMPFFQATSKKLPLTKEVLKVKNTKTIPTAGPYAWSNVVPDRLWVLKKNKFYKPGKAGHKRPQNINALRLEWNVPEEAGYLKTLKNQYDEGPLPAAHVQEVKKRFGTNKSRYWSKPLVGTGYLALNVSHKNGIFKGNVPMRKAVNWAVNRKQYVQQAGLDAGEAWTHLLPPGMPGAVVKKSKQPYSKTSKYTKAKGLASGHFKNGKIIVWYRNSSDALRNQWAIVHRDLRALGFKESNIESRGWDASIYDAAGERGANFDMTVSTGWLQDYPDPYDFVNILLHGGTNIHASGNVNYSYFNNPTYDKKMDKAARLVGKKRLKAYGKLDLAIAKNAAPMASMRTYNNRYLFSNRVNKKCLVYQGVYADWSIPALCLK
jgi:peptide/nickel transport system substrate-binding protein